MNQKRKILLMIPRYLLIESHKRRGRCEERTNPRRVVYKAVQLLFPGQKRPSAGTNHKRYAIRQNGANTTQRSIYQNTAGAVTLLQIVIKEILHVDYINNHERGYNMTTEEAITRLEIAQEQLQQEKEKNAELVMQIGALKQRLEELQAKLNEPEPANSRKAGRPKFNAQMVERLEEFKGLQTAGKNPADIMGLMNISRATYYNYLKACKTFEEF